MTAVYGHTRAWPLQDALDTTNLSGHYGSNFLLHHRCAGMYSSMLVLLKCRDPLVAASGRSGYC